VSADIDLDELGNDDQPPGRRTDSGRKSRKTNPLNALFGSRYRNPENQETLMGELHSIGIAFAILSVMMHGPECPTEISNFHSHKCKPNIYITLCSAPGTEIQKIKRN
jgi:hypothetical protein